jgi:hypothetical protein
MMAPGAYIAMMLARRIDGYALGLVLALGFVLALTVFS